MNIDIKDLLDDEELDPKKFFNEEEYSTLIINREGFNKKDNTTADLIEGLLDKEVSREESEAIFLKLKESKAQELLVNAIKVAERTEEKATLTAACWETGLDFTKHFLFFVELACSADFRLAMEALTVVENCESELDEATLNKALDIAESSEKKNPQLADDLIADLRQRM